MQTAALLKLQLGGVIPDGLAFGKGCGQVAAHANILAALPREQKSDLLTCGCGAAGVIPASRRALLRVRVTTNRRNGRIELGAQVRHVLGHDSQAQGRGARELALRLARQELEVTAIKPCRQPPGSVGECRRAVRAEHEEFGWRGAEAVLAAAAARVLFERDVEVAAAKAKGRNRCAPRVRAVAHPRARLGINVEGTVLDGQVRIGTLDLDGRRQHLVMQGQHGLDQRCCACRALGMADLRLDRANGTPLFGLTVSLGKYTARALKLGDVARLGCSTVCLQQFNRARRIAGNGICAAQRVRLSACLGRIDGRAFAVGTGAHAANHGIDAIAVAFGVFQPAQGQHPQSFA